MPPRSQNGCARVGDACGMFEWSNTPTIPRVQRGACPVTWLVIPPLMCPAPNEHHLTRYMSLKRDRSSRTAQKPTPCRPWRQRRDTDKKRCQPRRQEEHAQLLDAATNDLNPMPGFRHAMPREKNGHKSGPVLPFEFAAANEERLSLKAAPLSAIANVRRHPPQMKNNTGGG